MATFPRMPPLELLSTCLAEQRRQGRPFDEAWPVALGRALEASSDPEWIPALDGTRQAWQAAYDRGPAQPRERAALALAPDADAEIIDGDGPLCDRCGGPIPAGTRSVARFCSRVCQRASHGRIANAA